MSEIAKYENGSTVFAGDNVIDKNKIDKYPIVSNFGSLLTQIGDGELVDAFFSIATGAVPTPSSELLYGNVSTDGVVDEFEGPGYVVSPNKLSTMLLSTVVLASVYMRALDPSGVIGTLYQKITGSDKILLGHVDTATPSILIFCIWTGFGLNLIMFNGAMSRIPESVVESAKLEGVGFWRELVSITLPMIWPTFSMLMLLSVTAIFSATGPIVLFANQSDLKTSTIDFWMYQNIAAAEGANKEYNLASALGLILTIASLPIFLLVMWLRKKLNPDITY